MAADIVPIELGLTAGNLVTLWAPLWREDGEEWEAFLGHGENLYAFPHVAQLAAFIRTEDEHDLADHPDWEDFPDALTHELQPGEDRKFDLVGVPELVSGPADIWTLAELGDTVAILRSLAEVCDLDVVNSVLDSAEGFQLLSFGESAFSGRGGEKLWTGIGKAVVARWDEVIDALDAIVITPEVNAEALVQAEAEFASVAKLEAGVLVDGEREIEAAEDDVERSEELKFWDEIGIDCITVTVDGKSGHTLRCYLGQQAVFLSVANRIQIFTTGTGLLDYLADAGNKHTLSGIEVFDEVRSGAAAGDIEIVAGPENTYVIDGVMQQLAKGPEAVHPRKLELAVELLTDAATARGDEETTDAMTTATPLGSLLGACLRPDPNRLAPAPPFTDEVTAWNILVERFVATLDWDGGSDDEFDELD
ncbi:primosomal protein [Nakamurella antarctica]|uniref:Primosomal protein n=1 Tax=Nakamurella antarctica TaxID=1902245 RepID=A0A3G8ZMN2_9ACTN|nr:primosomal protein [Nakamurella antarctica]AZI58579.1 primosomal protein [Nakamurella antarctica]